MNNNDAYIIYDIDYDPSPLLAAIKQTTLKSSDAASGAGSSFINNRHPGWPAAEADPLIALAPIDNTRYAIKGSVRLLPAYESVGRHVDQLLPTTRRFHWPLQTHHEVVMHWPAFDIHLHMKVGKVYEVNTRLFHYVTNHSPVDRYHLVATFFSRE